MRKINSIIVHCSASNDNLDIGVKEITQWHRARGFTTCGYHFVIRRLGEIEAGRPLSEVGAHCFGHNQYSIGICLVGRDKFHELQIKSLAYLIEGLKRRFKLKDSDVYGHYEFDKGKTCPNLPMDLMRPLFTKDSTQLLELLKSKGKTTE
jgi:N-acetylmuramoyl-L-alanine amidase